MPRVPFIGANSVRAASVTVNLVNNPGFETGDLSHWNYSTTFPSVVHATQNVAHSGSYSAYIGCCFISQNLTSKNIVLSSTYRIDFWAFYNSSLSVQTDPPQDYLWLRLVNRTNVADPWYIEVKYWISKPNFVSLQNYTDRSIRTVFINYALRTLTNKSWSNMGGRYLRGDIFKALVGSGGSVQDWSRVSLLQIGVEVGNLFVDDFNLWSDLSPSKLSLEYRRLADNAVSLTGTLVDDELGYPFAGVPVDLEFRHNDTAPQSLTTVSTQSNGTYAYSWALPVLSGWYNVTARFQGNIDHSSSSATVEFGRFYTYHLITPGLRDTGSISRDISQIQFKKAQSYTLAVSLYVASFKINTSTSFSEPNIMSLSLSGDGAIEFSLGIAYPNVHVVGFTFGSYGISGAQYPWSTGQWYKLVISTQNGSTSFYVNANLIASSYPDYDFNVTRMYWGRFGDGALSDDVYATDLMIREDGRLVFAETFSNGLSAYSVTSSTGSTVETNYAGVSAVNPGLRGLSTILTTKVNPVVASPSQQLRVSGFLTDSNDSPLPSRMITIRYAVNSTLDYRTWVPVTATLTGPDGGYNVEFVPSFASSSTNSYEILASFDGDRGHSATKSSAVPILIGPPYPSRITLNLSTDSVYIGFSVEISGYLRGGPEMSPVEDANVVLEYSVPGVSTWTLITSAKTLGGGSFTATWIPQATGTFTVRASWVGNQNYSRSVAQNVLTNIAFGNQYVFSAVSNSTVSALAFNATNRTLSFQLIGEHGKAGYVEVTLSKQLVADISKVNVYLNGTAITSSYTSVDGSCRVQFSVVFGSSYAVTVSLGPPPSERSMPSSSAFPMSTVVLTAASAFILATAGVVIYKKRHKAS